MNFLTRPIPSGKLRINTNRWWGVLLGLAIGLALGAAEAYGIWYYVMSTTGGWASA